jgi:amino acid adenylation domain-containing protein
MTMWDRHYDRLAAAADQNEREREFWLNRLAGELVKTGFPCDCPGNGRAEQSMEEARFQFSEGLVEPLMKLGKGSQVKLHMILLAGLAVLLEQYSSHRDIIIGTPIYKQKQQSDFINTVLPIRIPIDAATTFKELLLQVRESVVQAAQHQNYPLEILVEQLNVPWTGKEFPLFDVVILVDGVHDKAYIRHIPCNVLFTFSQDGDDMGGSVAYNGRRYQRSTIDRIIDHYLRLLEKITTDVNQPVTAVDMLSEEERQRLLYEFNGPASALTHDTCLHRLFEEQVERTADRTALVSEESLQDWHLTFGELNDRANQLARLLRRQGIRPGSIAALMVDKSLGMMVGIWGILKAGGAYLNIDLAYPEGRSQYMLRESGTSTLLTYATHELPKAVTEDLALTCIDIFSPEVYGGDPDNLPAVNGLDDVAYIIYTSGSTGRPKGVVATHRNVAAYLHAFYREFDLGGQDVALQQASYAFDAFVEEVYPVMLRGGKVAICPRTGVTDSEALGRFIRKHHITFVSVSPLLLNELNKLPDTGPIRIFISGGDVLKREYLGHLPERGTVYNTYGPTETTVCATYYRCRGQDPADPPIGRPIANYGAFILDRYGRLLPLGVPGELCIAGPGVTRGYLNNPEFTAHKFVNFNGAAKSREGTRSLTHEILNPKSQPLYKTGDLCRFLPDGNIEFLGRLDRQVKIRGFRIELAEIERQLLRHEAITAVKVLTRDKEDGEKYLVANVVVSPKGTVDRTAAAIPVWREFLAASLPPYMIPSHFVILDSMPLTTSGKPDLKALYSHKPITGSDAEYIAPTTDMEMTLAEIWKELLSVEKVGIHDNFFDLGGNSILLLKAANKMREAFNRDIPYVAMFQYSTIHSLAHYLNSADEESAALDSKYKEQEDTLNRGKTRVKKWIKQTREAANV